MTQNDLDTGTVPNVTTGINLVARTTTGNVTLPALPGPGSQEIDLTDEGPVTFVDVAAKGQGSRREKIREASEEHGLKVANTAFFSETSKKYGLILRCKDCGVPVRKWTSDIHQSHRCDACTAKSKKAKAKAARAAKPADAS